VPSKSKAQADFFRAVAHSPEFAAKVKVPQSVGRDFYEADKVKKQRGRDRLARVMVRQR
jgi:hypothetical protein